MTLPIETQLPFNLAQIEAGGKELGLYMRDLVNELQDDYSDSADNIDGAIQDYTPIATGAMLPGVGTYTSQVGKYLRQGIRTTVWFNIGWSAHTGTGVLNISLPYLVRNTGTELFTGTVELWAIPFPAGYTYAVLKPLINSFTTRVQMCGNGVGSVSLPVPASGLIIGQAFYLGEESE